MATSNKEYEKIPNDIKEKIESKKAGLLFGDLVEDLKMIKKEMLENTLTFGFLDDNIEENLERFNSEFDIVLAGEKDFNSVISILKS